MQQWEYRIVTEKPSSDSSEPGRRFTSSASNHESYLNQMGQQGWELVTAFPVINLHTGLTSEIRYVLKRPKQ